MKCDAPLIQIYNFNITNVQATFDRIYHNDTTPATATYENLAVAGSMAVDALSASISYAAPVLNATIHYNTGMFGLDLDLQYDATVDCKTNPGKHPLVPSSPPPLPSLSFYLLKDSTDNIIGPQFTGVAMVSLNFQKSMLVLRGAIETNLCSHNTSISGSLVKPYELFTHLNVTQLALFLSRHSQDGETYSYLGMAAGRADFMGVDVGVQMQFNDSALIYFKTDFNYVNAALTVVNSLQFSSSCSPGLPIASGSGNISIHDLFNVDITLNSSMSYYGANCLAGSLWALDATGKVTGLIIFGMPLDASIFISVYGALYVYYLLCIVRF